MNGQYKICICNMVALWDALINAWVEYLHGCSMYLQDHIVQYEGGGLSFLPGVLRYTLDQQKYVHTYLINFFIFHLCILLKLHTEQ